MGHQPARHGASPERGALHPPLNPSAQRLSTWKTPARVHGLPGGATFGVELCGDCLEAQTLTARTGSQLAHVVKDHLFVRPESVRLASLDALSLPSQPLACCTEFEK